MDSWLEIHESNLSRTDRERHLEYLESLGALGNQTDDPDRPGTTRLGIFENRKISPKRLPELKFDRFNAKQARTAVLNYLLFFINLKSGHPGVYPDFPAETIESWSNLPRFERRRRH